MILKVLSNQNHSMVLCLPVTKIPVPGGRRCQHSNQNPELSLVFLPFIFFLTGGLLPWYMLVMRQGSSAKKCVNRDFILEANPARSG